MGKQAELIERYADELKSKLSEMPDMDFLTQLTIGVGPAIYSRDASIVAGSDKRELELIKHNFLIKKLGLKDSPDLDAALKAVVEQYGSKTRKKYRVVVYYLLAKHFNKIGPNIGNADVLRKGEEISSRYSKTQNYLAK